MNIVLNVTRRGFEMSNKFSECEFGDGFLACDEQECQVCCTHGDIKGSTCCDCEKEF